MIIIICGFTASGKSYLVENLAKRLNYKAIHTSDILKQIANNKSKIDIKKTKMNNGWYELSNLDNLRKKKESIDFKLDRYLLDLINKKKNLVLDSWTLPYLTDKGIRVWLNASLYERTKRMSIRDEISLNKALHLINKKDKFNKTHFKKIYNFKLGEDTSIYDYVIDTDNYTIQEVYNKAYKFIKSKL